MLRAMLSLPQIMLEFSLTPRAKPGRKFPSGIRVRGGTEPAKPYITWEQPLPARSVRIYRELIAITIAWPFSRSSSPARRRSRWHCRTRHL
jgi:hypothetical protein